MGVSKIVLNKPEGEEVLIDLTGDTVRADKLAKGYTAHSADGEPITGTMETDGGGAAPSGGGHTGVTAVDAEYQLIQFVIAEPVIASLKRAVTATSATGVLNG